MLILLIIFILGFIVYLGIITNFNVSYFFDIDLLILNSVNWLIKINWDYISLGILLMLIICFSYVYYYTHHYFSGDIAGFELNKLICLFVAVMATLVCTGDFLSTLILWEYLGVVSFFLILFYSNYLSLRSSIVTLVSSRFGDVCLFLLIGLMFFNNFTSWLSACLFFFIIFTKSAGYPFISWLLEAMRAPTPVSSLVHSSTLVAAGVWFALRYDYYSYFENTIIYSVLFLLTILITGICCFFFLDLKKIVALSTCNNISWCMIYLLFGDVCLCLFQLLSHGVSKCMLFMLVGDVMSGSGGSQASNCVYSTRLYGNLGIFGLFSIILGLSGAPFIGVFCTKHFFLSLFSGFTNILLLIFICLCVFLSYFYSFRLCHILINIEYSLAAGVLYTFNAGLMVYMWLFINFYLGSIIDENNFILSEISIFLILSQLVCCWTAYFLYQNNIFSKWSSSLFGCDNIVEYVYNIWISLNQYVSICFYRWDNNLLSIIRLSGNNTLYLYSVSVLNILIFGIFAVTILYGIVY
uniref:NADH dehydrogenase subunit 5 n=1 Tax=Nippotaenia mogurndae TaxID=116902 RepID=UPI0021CD0B8E|nr:NADH dehydrogenase subunit 5 [Nippotaenia mogurndae]UWT58585.1 NADH dehydrogenase subunit 5 [Nippotaenia mogurndae]